MKYGLNKKYDNMQTGIFKLEGVIIIDVEGQRHILNSVKEAAAEIGCTV